MHSEEKEVSCLKQLKGVCMAALKNIYRQHSGTLHVLGCWAVTYIFSFIDSSQKTNEKGFIDENIEVRWRNLAQEEKWDLNQGLTNCKASNYRQWGLSSLVSSMSRPLRNGGEEMRVPHILVQPAQTHLDLYAFHLSSRT